MRALAILFALVAAPQIGAAQEAGNRLNLVCDGGGTANKVNSTSAFGWNNRGDRANAVVVGRSAVGFADQLQLWIEDTQGKARMPRTMLPKLHGGDGGWFDITDIKVSDTEITGTVGVNFMNHPKLVLDRLTGTITLDGKAGQFNGHCQKFDPSTAPKAF